MVSQFEKQINTFTKNLTATLGTKQIQWNEFYKDIIDLKTKQLSKQDFINKYDVLFNGTYAKYGIKYVGKSDYSEKAVDSFLGSYRRSTLPKNFKKVSDKDIVRVNRDLRDKTYIVVPKYKQPLPKKVGLRRQKDRYFSHIKLKGFVREALRNYKNVWQIDSKGTLRTQEVQLLINYDVFSDDTMRKLVKAKKDKLSKKGKQYAKNKKPDKDGNIVFKDMWLRFPSHLSSEKTLIELFDIAYNEFLEWFWKLSQSKLYVKLKKSFTEIFRKIDP